MIILVFAAILILLSPLSPLSGYRQYLENKLILPLRTSLLPELQPVESLRILSLQEELQELKQENQTMREQLGAIPDKANLLVARVVWQGDHELILHYQTTNSQNLINRPVIFGEFFLGKIIRQSPNQLLVQMPVSSGFNSDGITDNNSEGEIKGKFNNQVIFEVKTDAELNKNSQVYYLDKTHAWRFLIGKINQIKQDERLSKQQAVIDYLPQQTQLKTVFVVL